MGILDDTPQNGYCLYIHINRTNDKVYIGISKDVKKRWAGKAHAYKHNPLIQNAFKKYGWDGFIHLVICDGMTLKEACEKEKQWICAFKREGMSYNITDGGEGRQGVKRTEAQNQAAREKMLGRKMSLEAIAKMIAARKGVPVPKKYKRVFAFDKNTKEFIKSYTSIQEAAKENNLHVSAVSNSARGKCPSAGPYIWSFTSTIDGDSPRYKLMEGLKVYCYDKEGNFIQIFSNTREAASFIGGLIVPINDCCSGRNPSYKGYIWRKELKEKETLMQEVAEIKARKKKYYETYKSRKL